MKYCENESSIFAAYGAPYIRRVNSEYVLFVRAKLSACYPILTSKRKLPFRKAFILPVPLQYDQSLFPCSVSPCIMCVQYNGEIS